MFRVVVPVERAAHGGGTVASRGRSLATRLLVILASALSVLALVVGYVTRAAINSDQFANRATAALRDDSVRSLVAQRVTDQLVLEKRSDLVAARPLIESIVSGVVGGRAFTSAFRSGVRDVHRTVVARDEHTVTLTLADVGTVVAAALDVVQPSIARRVEATRRVELLQRDIGAVGSDAARLANAVKLLAVLLAVLAIAAAAGALALSGDRRRTVVQLGIGVAAGGFVVLVAYGVGRSFAVGNVEGSEKSAAVAAIWDAFLGDLRTAALLFGAVGAVVAGAAASVIRPVDIDEPLRRAGRWIAREPTRPSLRALRGACLVAVGLLFLLNRDIVLQVLVAAAGFYLVYTGVTAILRVVHQPRPAADEPVAASGGPARERRHRTLVASLVAGVVIVGAVAAFLGSGGATTPAPAAGACNGHVALCGRPLDQVALPATHNSMSAPLPGWFSSQQDRPIPAQLRDGIRGLLIDTHYADRLSDGRLRTVFSDPEQLREQAQQDGVSPSAVDAALRLRDRRFSGQGSRGMYLCHSFCELGGTPLSDVLRQLHDFLVANPGEVVVVINQDYVTPEDFVSAVERSGLGNLVYRGGTGPRQWPTLRELIDSNQRAVFLAEHHAGEAPWYHLAYQSITEETPYAFSQPPQLTDPSRLVTSCRPNRGPADAPLFLVNHWITTDPVPLPSNAARVNAFEPLLRRLRECRRIRDHVLNLVAVDFYARGDLFRVVDALNGVT